MRLLVLLLSAAAVFALSSAATTSRPIETTPVEDVDLSDDITELENYADVVTDNEDPDDNGNYELVQDDDNVEESDDDLEDGDDDENDDGSESPAEIDLLTDEEFEEFIEAKERKFASFFDDYVGTEELKKRLVAIKPAHRQKRWVPLAIAGGRFAFSAGRALLSRYARRGITSSGSRLTKHYSRPGNYFTGLREFRNLNPTNVKRIGGSKFNGWTGQAGPYRVTMRSGSKGTGGANGAPTLSISSKGGDLVRKFRFD